MVLPTELGDLSGAVGATVLIDEGGRERRSDSCTPSTSAVTRLRGALPRTTRWCWWWPRTSPRLAAGPGPSGRGASRPHVDAVRVVDVVDGYAVVARARRARPRIAEVDLTYEPEDS